MKSIDYKKIDITDDEYNYYLELVKQFTNSEENLDGKEYFRGLFETDKDGFIVLIKTEKSVPWSILFFVQQIMLSQRIRENDKYLQKNKELISKLESIFNLQEKK